MKLIAGTILACGAAVGYFAVAERQPADVYAMPVNETYKRLAKADLMPGGESFYGKLQFTAVGDGRETITWTGNYSFSRRSCDIDLSPWAKDPAKTHVRVVCKGGSLADGAASGMAHNYFRNAVIEKVDSTLAGRPFDEVRARGSTAAGWPGDGVDGSLGTAAKNAIQMSKDMAEMEREMKAQERREAEQAKWDDFYDAEPAGGAGRFD